MGADQCEEAGLDVIPMPNDIREELKKRGSPIWDWISNPADFSIQMGDSGSGGEITLLIGEHPDFDLIIQYLSPPHSWGGRGRPVLPIEEHLKHSGVGAIKKPMFIVLQDRGRSTSDTTGESLRKFNEFRDKLVENRLPTYPTIGAAANAAAKMVAFYQNRERAIAAACL